MYKGRYYTVDTDDPSHYNIHTKGYMTEPTFEKVRFLSDSVRSSLKDGYWLELPDPDLQVMEGL